MRDNPVEFSRDTFTVSTDRARLDVDVVHRLLETTHWGAGLPRAVLERAIENSLCFGLYEGARLAGFARAVTDLATYAYLTDVVVDHAYRGRGLGRWMVECIVEHPALQGLRRLALVTRDAPDLYARVGFGRVAEGLTYLERRGR